MLNFKYLRYVRQWRHNAETPTALLAYAVATSVVRYPRYIDTYATIPVSPRTRYTAVYSSTKYRETAQVSCVLSIPCSSDHLAFSNGHIASL